MFELDTMITSVDAEQGIAEVTVHLGDAKDLSVLFCKNVGFGVPSDDWDAAVKVDTGLVKRVVEVGAIASSDVLGSGSLIIGQIQVAPRLYLTAYDPAKREQLLAIAPAPHG